MTAPLVVRTVEEAPTEVSPVPPLLSGMVEEDKSHLLLNVVQSEVERHPACEPLAVRHVSKDGVVPMTEIGCDNESAPFAVRVVVATEPSLAGVPFVVVQYESCPAVSFVEVATFPVAVALIVTAPVAPETVMLFPATIDVTPELVKVPLLFESPVPSRLLND